MNFLRICDTGYNGSEVFSYTSIISIICLVILMFPLLKSSCYVLFKGVNNKILKFIITLMLLAILFYISKFIVYIIDFSTANLDTIINEETGCFGCVKFDYNNFVYVYLSRYITMAVLMFLSFKKIYFYIRKDRIKKVNKKERKKQMLIISLIFIVLLTSFYCISHFIAVKRNNQYEELNS